MIGLDTTVLVAFELQEAPAHQRVRESVLGFCEDQVEKFLLCPQVLQEFLHVVTDPRRFENPMLMEDALIRSQAWWNAAEVIQCLPDASSTAQFHDWMISFRLGRKRILDTALASVYHLAGVERLATANPDDFKIFEVFEFETWALS
jgi:predicted nucleic acid-binding protein